MKFSRFYLKAAHFSVREAGKVARTPVALTLAAAGVFREA